MQASVNASTKATLTETSTKAKVEINKFHGSFTEDFVQVNHFHGSFRGNLLPRKLPRKVSQKRSRTLSPTVSWKKITFFMQASVEVNLLRGKLPWRLP